MPKSLPRVICIVPVEEEAGWHRVRPWVELLSYSEYDLRKIRQMVLNEFEDEDVHVIARHDLVLTRRLPSIGRLSQCTKLDIITLVEWIQHVSKVYHHGSVSERRKNKLAKEPQAHIAGPSLLNFYRPDTISGFCFLDAPETLADHDLTLWLLRGGYKNVVNYEFACRSVSPVVVTKEDAFKLERRHPGLVEAVEWKPGKWGTSCQWRKAYDVGC